MTPLRRAVYAWLSLSWLRRVDVCRHLGLPLQEPGEPDVAWGRRVFAEVKARGLEADLRVLCEHIDAGAFDPARIPAQPERHLS